MRLYKHTQPGTLIRWAMAAGLLATAIGLATATPFPVKLALALGSATLLLTLVLCWSLTIQVDERYFRFHFGPRLINKKILLTDIESCQAVESGWAWGIHWLGSKGWLYNVSGFRAVSVQLKSGKRFLVGSDEPEAVCQAIKHAQACAKSEAKE